MIRAAKKSLAELAIMGGLVVLVFGALVGFTSVLGWLGYFVVLIPFFVLVGGR